MKKTTANVQRIRKDVIYAMTKSVFAMGCELEMNNFEMLAVAGSIYLEVKTQDRKPGTARAMLLHILDDIDKHTSK